MRKRAYAVIRHLIFWSIFIVVLYLAAAVAGAVFPGRTADLARGPSADTEMGPDVEIGLIAGPIHYDFILPATPETRAALSFAREGGVPVQAAWVQNLVVGWGAAGFYSTTGGYWDVTASTVWRAVTGDTSVLRVDAVGPLPPELDYRRVSLTAAQYSAFLEYIRQTASGGVVPGAGFTQTDAFFEARGRFHILRHLQYLG